MSQHYVDPQVVRVPESTRPRASRSLIRILERDGQIVPVLVRTKVDSHDLQYWEAADTIQGERVVALRELAWPTILIEDQWTEDDL